jgi:hypothetical protein
MVTKKTWYVFLFVALIIIFFLRIYVFNDSTTSTHKYPNKYLKGYEFEDKSSSISNELPVYSEENNNSYSNSNIEHNNRYNAEYINKVYDNNININNNKIKSKDSKEEENKTLLLQNNEKKLNQELLKTNHELKTKKLLDKLKIGNSNSSRLLFIIGLDFSGYKSIVDMFSVCNSSLPSTCIGDDILTNTINLQVTDATLAKELFITQDKNHINSNQNIIENRMKEIANEQQGKLYYYATNHFDFFSIAKLAELHNLDFRILFIQRSAKDILSDG